MITVYPQGTMNAWTKLFHLIAGELGETFGLLMELTVKVNVPWISWLFSVIKAFQSRPECWPLFPLLLVWLVFPPDFIRCLNCFAVIRPAQVSHQSACLWWICMVRLTLWRWCLPIPSGPGTVHLCHCKHRFYDFRHHLSETITRPGSLLSITHIILCIASTETATSPWWPGSAAPAWRFAGWIVSRTSRSCVCARPPQGHA